MKRVTWRGLLLSSALAFAAGFVDAIGFIETGGLFVSFMSGNSTQAGVELLGGEPSMAMMSVFLLLTFVLGVAAAGTLSLHARDHRPYVVAVAGIAIGSVGVLELVGMHSAWSYGLVAAAMGAINTLYLEDGRARVAITYATGTLVSLGLALAALLNGRSRTAWRRPLLLWGSLAVGALSGAAAHRFGAAALLLAATAMLVVLAVVLAVRSGTRAPGR